MELNSKIFVAGHNGMVGSAIVRRLKELGYTNIITKGKIKEFTIGKEVNIYGKPDDVANRFSKLINNCVKDVNDDKNPILVALKTNKNVPDTVYRNIKETLKNFLKNEIILKSIMVRINQ